MMGVWLVASRCVDMLRQIVTSRRVPVGNV